MTHGRLLEALATDSVFNLILGVASRPNTTDCDQIREWRRGEVAATAAAIVTLWASRAIYRFVIIIRRP